MPEDEFNHYTSDSNHHDTRSWENRRLSLLLDVPGRDILDQPLTSHSSPDNTYLSRILHPYASTLQPPPPPYSDQHSSNQTSSADDDLDRKACLPAPSAPRKEYTCDTCGNKFSKRVLLIEHVITYHDTTRNEGFPNSSFATSDPTEKYACAQCGKRCFQDSHLKDHLTINSDERAFACPDCNKRYKRARNLKNHMIKHSISPTTVVEIPQQGLCGGSSGEGSSRA